MDKALKARKMASASMRKQRIQERAQQKTQMHEDREERKRKMMRLSQAYSTHDSDDSDASDDSNASDSSSPLSPESNSLAKTPSEYSVRTPENNSSPEIAIQDSLDMTVHEVIKKEDEVVIMTTPTILERQSSRPISFIPHAALGASLSRPSDFRYDRFSTFVDPVEVLHMKRPEEPVPPLPLAQNKTEDDSADNDDDDDDDDDDEEDYSPIELATPVAIRMPVGRPAVVAVIRPTTPQTGPQKFSIKNINTIMINPPKQPTPKPRVVETLPTPESKPQEDYSFPVSGSKSIERVASSSASIRSIDSSSTMNRSSMAIQMSDQNVKKKSSMPMLTKLTHARMNSLKNFIKPQSISGPPPAVPMIPTSHQPRPSESMSNILLSNSTHKSKPSVADKHLPSSPRRSLTVPHLPPPPPPERNPHERRPQTSRSQSHNMLTNFTNFANHSHHNITPLPRPISVAPPMPQTTIAVEDSDGPAINRKKSFQNLRRRSGSLGQALKFTSASKTKNPTLEAPLPPMPQLTRAPTQESIAPVHHPIAPPKPQRSTRKSGMMYSPFPPPSQRAEPVGLGLRM